MVPSITLPKGGGAIRGIGEKFGANPVTGTGSMTVPVATSPGRSGFGPELTLSYDSGSGNGLFGFGWSLSLPAISRKTEKGLPRYRDNEESDVFILSGAEDLVPSFAIDDNGELLIEDGEPTIDEHDRVVDGATYRVRRYRPRVEGSFARIERWTKDSSQDVHWRTISKDNVLTIYGGSSESRIADPTDPSRVFSWLICETRDDRGNGIVYDYKSEDAVGVDLEAEHQRNRGDRDDLRRRSNRYLKRIRYGNRSTLLDASGQRPPFLGLDAIANANWMFEVALDYGEHDLAAPKPSDAGNWTPRPDAFSSYRSGFEVRTTRLCRRVLMFHHFEHETGVGLDCLVRSTDFEYSTGQHPTNPQHRIYSFLQSVTQAGYRRTNDGYRRRALPSVEFEYSPAVVQPDVAEVDSADLENLPIGLDGNTYQWVDLHGEGTAGILTEQADAWLYKRNLSPASAWPVEFAPTELVAVKPQVALAGGLAQIMDLAGDGLPDVVMLDGTTPGIYEHDEAEGWDTFRSFAHRLNLDLRDPNLRFVDLDGDGHADVLITESDALVWHRSLGEDGFGPAQRIAIGFDEDQGPQVVFNDATELVSLADLSGDGLTDLVRIRNGDVCYWPNLGYGRFGAKVTMDDSPWFDRPDQFDPKRIRLADIDGSGTTDIVYLSADGPRLYFNESGNSWSEPKLLRNFPRIDDVVSVVVLDLLGNGTACLVWSSPLPGDVGRSMRYVNLMGEQKPHLLVKSVNNLGVETRVHYAPSTKFYLQDKHDGKPWITRLPFPVHVVERVETYDYVSRNRFVTRYAYHHGYFDGDEREFRGFGMVEQWDTEQFAALADGAMPGSNIDAASHVPPVHTKTWFHTGLYRGREHVSAYFAGLVDANDDGEYYREPDLDDDHVRAVLLTAPSLPTGATLQEEREACRALKGSMLRQEVYADDAGPTPTAAQNLQIATPYTVTDQSFTVKPVQPLGANRHAVFFAHPCETVSHHYERNPADPRVQHSLTLEVDRYGNVLKQATVGYGRRHADPSLPTQWDKNKQTMPLVTYTESAVTNAIDSPDAHRTPLLCESLTFELTGHVLTEASRRFTASDFVEPDPGHKGLLRSPYKNEVAYEAAASGELCRRPIERVRTLYRSDDLVGLLPLRALQSRALPGEDYKLAFTPGLIDQIFTRPHAPDPAEQLLPNPDAVLGGQAGDRGGYVQSQTLKADGRFPAGDADGHWWIPSGRVYVSPNPADDAAAELTEGRQHFFLPRRYRDPFGHDTLVDFDDHDLLMVETRDAVDNRVTVNVNDYRVLQPSLVSDPNLNQTEVAFDTLGMVVGTAIMGKPSAPVAEGDTLDGFLADVTQDDIDKFLGPVDPHGVAVTLLHDATTRVVYDLDRFANSRRTNPDDQSKWLPACAATLARETHVRAVLPPHGLKIQLSFSYSDGFGREIQKKVQAEPGPVVNGGPTVDPRWVGTGWVILNNKGQPVRQYEPFFSPTHEFEFNAIHGVSSVLFYDPVGRVVATLNPDHTYTKVVFDPWQQTTHDANDTCAVRPAPPGGPPPAQTGDPRTDPDIGSYVVEYFAAQPDTWETWHAARISNALGADERNAAIRAAAHADTPTTAYLDSLGRTFLTVSRNRVECPGHELDGTEDTFATRVLLDIEGNQREVRDERKLPVGHLPTGATEQRVVMQYAYDMRGNRLRQLSMEAGARWTLNDVAGKPIRAWDSRGHNHTTTYDALRRPVAQFVRGAFAGGDGASDPRTLNQDILVELIDYGEPASNATAEEHDRALRLNLRTRVYRHSDSAGQATNARLDAGGNPTEAFDFKGNLLGSTRRLLTDYKGIADWHGDPQLDAEYFETSTRYDALNRPTQVVAPHSSVPQPQRPNAINVVQPVFNAANLLDRVDVWLELAAEPGDLLNSDDLPQARAGVTKVDYDAKGQRQRIAYANGARTEYRYDPLTFRLIQLVTTRDPTKFGGDDPPPDQNWTGRLLQNLHYTYDPAGNITHIQDDAQQAIFFRNKRVEPSNDYIYDACYRLIQATGREHLGQTAGALNPPTSPGAFNAFHTGLDHPGDGAAMGTYVERFVYDAVGNFLQMQHRGADPAHSGWTQLYDYVAPSLTEPGLTPPRFNNQLTGTTLDPNGAKPKQFDGYAYDAHGNMVRMPHLGSGGPGPNMFWDHKDQLRQVDRRGGGQAWFVYDACGQRVRKVWAKSASLIEERIYLGNFEIFRRHKGQVGADTAVLERETLHVMDDKQRIALVETRTLDKAGDDQALRQRIRCQFGNHLGSAALELDDQAQIISYEEYSPYGGTTYQAMRSRTETAKRYRYTGKERDEETGLSYHGARYYAPWLARWTSCDPLGFVDGPSLYVYVRDNPIVLVDPLGHRGESPVDPETMLLAANALKQAVTAMKSASPAVTGGGGAASAAAPSTEVAAVGMLEGAAAALATAQIVAAAAEALAVKIHMERSGSIVRYHNPFGMSSDAAAFPQLDIIAKLHSAPFPEPEIETKPDRKNPRMGRVYVTYTKVNAITGKVYSGRTSAVIDLNLPWGPQADDAVATRDKNHHIEDETEEPSDPGFKPAELDKYAVGFAVDYRERYRDFGYAAIRGREQQLIDANGLGQAAKLGQVDFKGGAQSDTNPGVSLTENRIRGVSKDHRLGEVFHAASSFKFRSIAPFTGYPTRVLQAQAK